jgi:hypothetical protein
MPDHLAQMQAVDRGIQALARPIRHYGLTTNEWGIGLRCHMPRPDLIWRIMRPEEEEEPEGLLKWYLRGLKPQDDPSALVTALAVTDPNLRLLKSTAHGLLLSSLMPLPYPLMSVRLEDGSERHLIISPANYAARQLIEGHHPPPPSARLRRRVKHGYGRFTHPTRPQHP